MIPHGKQTRLVAAFALPAALLARGVGRRRTGWRGVQNAALKNRFRVREALPAKGFVWPQVSVADGNAEVALPVAHKLTARAGGLVAAWVRRPVAVDGLRKSSSEDVREIESVEDLPKLGLADPLNRGARHMLFTETFDRLDGYARGRLDRADLELWLEAETWDASPGYARQLAFDVLRLFAETDNGDWTPREVRSRVASLIEPRMVAPVTVVGTRIAGLETLDEPRGIRIPRVSETLVQTFESAVRDPISQRSGIGIHETTPLAVR